MVNEISFKDGPYLLAAIICEKVLEEKNGVKSVIRIIDRLERTAVSPTPPKEMEAFEHELTLLIRMKSGMARGPLTLNIRLVKPSGESPQPMTQVLHFEGEEDRGIDFVANMRIKFDMTGIYWFHVLLEDVRLTQIPLRVIYLPQVRQIRDPVGPP